PRLARGCRCFAVVHRGTLVAYGWLSAQPEWIGELGLEIAPTAGEAYVWNCVTLPAHRRQGRYRALVEGIVARARAEGMTRLWIGSIEDPAEKADADAGFRPVVHFTVARVGRLRWIRARPAPEARGGLAEEARRRLGLRSWSDLGRAPIKWH
ncbi:MAG TPA: GNAT family N-acetyltransferase, partial [Candidatus Dormibacteraeota bacterium]|nr:GNAT family N-acetyltransferase [Candidatus Dormibacteraeota bacterium]